MSKLADLIAKKREEIQLQQAEQEKLTITKDADGKVIISKQ